MHLEGFLFYSGINCINQSNTLINYYVTYVIKNLLLVLQN